MKKEKTVKDELAFVSAPLGIGKNTHRHISLEKQKQNLERRIFFVLCSSNTFSGKDARLLVKFEGT